jgi:hypothetical protein
VEIKRSGSQPSGKGPAEWFTGTVRIDPLYQAPDPARVVAASVTFEPGARHTSTREHRRFVRAHSVQPVTGLYVGLRVAHSLVQAIINVVILRFAIFMAASFVLLVMSVRAASIAF